MNRASYDAIADRWDAARTDFHGQELRYLALLLADLPRPASILDLGCGTGRPIAGHLLRLGHRVTGVDQSEGMLAIARARHPEATWIHARMEDHAFDDRHDAVVCWDSLFHVERAHHRAILAGIHRCLAPGGRLMLTVGGSAHPPFTDTMFGHEFFYDSFPPDEVLRLLDAVGFELVLGEFMNLPTRGRDKGRYAVVARRPPDPEVPPP